MNGWFLAIIIFNVLGLGIVMQAHGKPKEGKYSFWSSLFSTLLILFLTYMAIAVGF